MDIIRVTNASKLEAANVSICALRMIKVVSFQKRPCTKVYFDLWGVDQTADLEKEAREINDSLRAIARP